MRLRREVTKCELCLLDGKSAPTSTWDSIESMPSTQIWPRILIHWTRHLFFRGSNKKKNQVLLWTFLGHSMHSDFHIFSHWEPSVSRLWLAMAGQGIIGVGGWKRLCNEV